MGELEARVANGFQEACALVADAGMDQERRALRLAVRELKWESEPGGPMGQPSAIVLRFRLTRGSFATTVLRELIESNVPGEEGGD